MAKKKFIGYRTYNFVDKDPVIDELRTIVKDDGSSYSEINEKSGVSYGTLRNWFHGETKRPQFATVSAVAKSLGYEYRLIKTRNR